MRVLVTGANGFVGRWLVRELAAGGHEVVAAPASDTLDVTDGAAVEALVRDVRPEAIAHLAGVSHAQDARRDPDHAFAVNEGGTRHVVEAAGSLEHPAAVLVTGSSEVYGRPDPADLPLRESAPLRTDQPYGRSKLAQERTAIEVGHVRGVPVVVTRSFNHTGPGQRPDFVAPALAHRVIEAKRSGSHVIAVGNLDVRRDLGDVRDVVRAYRLLLEGLRAGNIPSGSVLNVSTGRAVTIRRVLELVSAAVGAATEPETDPDLVRKDDPPEIVGDASALRQRTGWEPQIPLEQTLRDLVASVEGGAPAG